MSAAWAEMFRTGEIKTETGVCKGGNNRPCDGYELCHKGKNVNNVNKGNKGNATLFFPRQGQGWNCYKPLTLLLN